MADITKLENALKSDQDKHEGESNWIDSIEKHHPTPAKLEYRPLFEDVIGYVIEDRETELTLRENLKEASRYVAREAWKDFCLEDMWDKTSLTCVELKAMHYMGEWIYLLQANLCLYFNKTQRIIQLNDRTSGPCSEFRMEEERGTIEVKGEEGILAYKNGDTSDVSIIDGKLYADSFAAFRFTYKRDLRVRKGEDNSEKLYLYAKDGFLHLGPMSEADLALEAGFSVKKTREPRA